MPTIFTHSIAGLAISSAKNQTYSKFKYYSLIIISACIPDADVISFKLGISYQDILGHRGITHSILFAFLFSFCITKIFFSEKILSKEFIKLFLVFFFVNISHSILDAMTNGGLGVCLFCPFVEDRFFFEFRPVLVSPIGKYFFSQRGLEVLKSEFFWIWIPSVLFYLFLKTMNWLYFKINKN